MVLKPGGQSWVSCPHNALAQTPEGKHRRAVPKVGVRVAQGSLGGSHEYANRLVPGGRGSRKGAGGARAGSKLAPEAAAAAAAGDANQTPPAVAGSPQNGSKTGLPWSAARAPSSVPDPVPVPTRHKLKKA